MQNEKWNPPDENRLKLNCDGACHHFVGKSAFGSLLRNRDGKWVRGVYGSLCSNISTEPEIDAIYHGMQMMKNRGDSGVVIESDCQTAVDYVKKPSKCSVTLRDTCQFKLISCERLMRVKQHQIQHVARCANACANRLANLGFDSNTDYRELEEAPDDLELSVLLLVDSFDSLHDLTYHLHSNNLFEHIKFYLRKNPGSAPMVVGQLLDENCPEDSIKDIISVGSQFPVVPLVAECEKRSRLHLLTQFLEHLVSEGSQDVHVHNALGKIIIDSNNNPVHFLTTNKYYDSRVVGKYCEKHDPRLAVAAYRRAQCDDELVIVTSKNSLFNVQARYVVERMDGDLWEKVLNPENEYRRQLIDQVVSTALPESKSPEQVSAVVKAFMTADLSHEISEPLIKTILQNPAFSGNLKLQGLLILKVIKADSSRVKDYVNIYGSAVGEVAVEAKLYDEAFTIFENSKLNVQAVNVLLDNIQSIPRAIGFARRVNEPDVWSQVAKAQLRKGLVSDAIKLFILADDATQFLDVIRVAENTECYDDLVKYLLMVGKKTKEPKVDSELIYAYAKIHKLREMEELIVMSDVADLHSVHGRLIDERLHEAAQIIDGYISDCHKLVARLVKNKDFQGAVNAARKVNSSKAWKEVCFAYVDAKKFHLAQMCGLNMLIIIVQVDELKEVSEYYQNKGYFNELISLMESGLVLEGAHMGIFTELGVLYARYCYEKLMEHIKLFSTRLYIPELIRACVEQQHWKELTYLYIQCDEFDTAASTVMDHSPDAWDHLQFKDIALKVANVDLCYSAVEFYLKEHPDLINDVLNVLALRVDHTRVVNIMREAGHLPLVKPYMVAVQCNNVSAINEALNEIYVEEDDYIRLRESIDLHDNFDQIGLAQKIENHELLEMRRVAAYIYKKAGRWNQSIALSKKDKVYKDAMVTASQSGDCELAKELLVYFIDQGKKECFAVCLYVCYDLIPADVALELAWLNNMIDFAFPYLIQFIREYTGEVDVLIGDKMRGRTIQGRRASRGRTRQRG